MPTKNLALFVQDDWHATNHLTLSLGLRYDSQYGAFNENLNLAKFPRPLPYVDLSQRGDRNNFGPRVGFVYDPSNEGRSVLRGGYGITMTTSEHWRTSESGEISKY